MPVTSISRAFAEMVAVISEIAAGSLDYSFAWRDWARPLVGMV